MCAAISKLNCGIGPDNVHLNNLKYCTNNLLKLLARLFSACIIHGILPNKINFGIIMPLFKDKYKDSSSINNYRSITLLLMLSKVFEYCLQTSLLS